MPKSPENSPFTPRHGNDVSFSPLLSDKGQGEVVGHPTWGAHAIIFRAGSAGSSGTLAPFYTVSEEIHRTKSSNIQHGTAHFLENIVVCLGCLGRGLPRQEEIKSSSRVPGATQSKTVFCFWCVPWTTDVSTKNAGWKVIYNHHLPSLSWQMA